MNLRFMNVSKRLRPPFNLAQNIFAVQERQKVERLTDGRKSKHVSR